MRIGIWRGAATACALLGACAASASAGVFHDTIPELTPALDYRTGQQYYAPPIPYGHYVGKDIPGHLLGAAYGSIGLARGAVHTPLGLIKGKIGGLFHGRGCGHCGGTDCDGGIVSGSGPRSDQSGPGYSASSGGPTPLIQGQVLGGPAPTIQGQTSGGPVPIPGQWLGAPAPIRSQAVGGTTPRPRPALGGAATTRDPALRGTGWRSDQISGGVQPAFTSPQAGASGHQVVGPGLPSDGSAQPCGPIGGDGDGAGAGCGHGGACHQGGGHGGKLRGLLGLPHHVLGTVRGLPHTALGAAYGVVGTIFHHGDIDYFVGPGGPVPLTPGYVPYVVPTRSPRDFLSFPPYSTLDP